MKKKNSVMTEKRNWTTFWLSVYQKSSVNNWKKKKPVPDNPTNTIAIIIYSLKKLSNIQERNKCRSKWFDDRIINCFNDSA